MGKIKELLLDVEKGPCVVLAGETDWFKLDNIGTVFRNTRFDTAIGGRMYGVSDDA